MQCPHSNAISNTMLLGTGLRSCCIRLVTFMTRNCVPLVALLLTLRCAGTFAADQVDFSRDVLPILSDRCYSCHGPDEAARKAKLRLDTREGAFAARKDRVTISPGKPSESELVRRINSHDADEVMPPGSLNRPLSREQIALLTAWVEQGAAWGKHWAFVAPTQPVVPQVKQAAWVKNPVDAFVLARLEHEGLAPSVEADRPTLIRRVTLDLTGLPPTPAEVESFVTDSAPDAYEKLVDRLLASPRYGERMAVDWLDLARYADTHGYQMDRYRAMWPYRDWVIAAFNQNLPYDQFATWQLAGDLLPNSTKPQRLATAFNRLHMQNEEGGIVAEEFRVAYVVDRVNTYATTFLALTTECSRCHDHKFDPITQKDFYSLFAFFQNIDESGQTTYFTDATPVPALLLSTAGQDAELADLRQQIAHAEEKLKSLRQSSTDDFSRWLKSRGKVPVPPGLVGSFDLDAIVDGKLANAADAGKPGKPVENPQVTDSAFGKAAQLDGENGFVFPGVGHFTRADGFSFALRICNTLNLQNAVVVHHTKAPIDAGSRGYELLIEDGKFAVGLHHMWPGNSLKIRAKKPLESQQWTHVAVTYDGSSRATGLRIYVNGEPAEVDVIRDGLTKDITYGGGEPDLAIGHRFRDAGFKGGMVNAFRVYDRAITPLEVKQLADGKSFNQVWQAPAENITPAQRSALEEYFFTVEHAPSRELAKKLHALREQERDLVNPIPEAMTMKELPKPKPAYVLKRGAYDAPGDAVAADTPAELSRLKADRPHNRLGLAQWTFDDDNPLVGRVAANRLWQQMFGIGIVATSDNFGSQGSQPTHPDLLDWLACEYRATGWDTKRMLRTIALSATYRQSSRADDSLRARDPANELLARGPARRLSAEMLRDQALAFSGLLTEKIGGPSVKPYQPDGLWDVAMGKPHYDQGNGDDLHRRSLYTFWKRTVPPPAMMTFDAADRSYCTARRQSTSTPLQALALLNDVQIVEAARSMSGRMFKEGGAAMSDRAAWMFRLATGREPSERQLQTLVTLYDEQRDLFAAHPDAAKQLLAVGEANVDGSIDPADLAAGTVLAQAILNYDQTVMRR